MIEFSVPKLHLISASLDSQAKQLHDTYDMTAQLNEATLEIRESGEKVFWISITAEDNCLVLDRAETLVSQRQRGLGTLGLFISLMSGLSTGKRFVKLGTQIEPNAYGFWCGMQFASTPLIGARIALYSKIIAPRPTAEQAKAATRARLLGPLPKKRTQAASSELIQSLAAKADKLAIVDYNKAVL